jgi:hypothetical protein
MPLVNVRSKYRQFRPLGSCFHQWAFTSLEYPICEVKTFYPCLEALNAFRPNIPIGRWR